MSRSRSIGRGIPNSGRFDNRMSTLKPSFSLPFQTALGDFVATWTERGLAALSWMEVAFGGKESLPNREPHPSDGSLPLAWKKRHLQLVEELGAYSVGCAETFSIPLDLPATPPFTQKVWEELRKIRFGEMATYGEIASRIGHPSCARAVGRACHGNPIPIVIPCHRVVGQKGWLGGFRGGIDRKRRLLLLEGKTDLVLASFTSSMERTKQNSILPQEAYLGLGANLGDRKRGITEALLRLSLHPQVEIIQVAPLLETDPVGPGEQPCYLNTVCRIRTSLSPRDLLSLTMQIEKDLGRDRTKEIRWGPRPIDIDLLFYGDQIVEEPDLILPHPRLHERDFVLIPLLQIAPKIIHPRLGIPLRNLRR